MISLTDENWEGGFGSSSLVYLSDRQRVAFGEIGGMLVLDSFLPTLIWALVKEENLS